MELVGVQYCLLNWETAKDGSLFLHLPSSLTEKYWALRNWKHAFTPWKGVYKRLSFIETAWNKVFIVDLKAQQVNLCNFFFNLQSEQQRTLSFHSFHTKSRRSLHTFSYTCYRTFRISLIGRSHVPAGKVHPMLQTTSNVRMTHGKCQVTSLPLPSPSPVSLRSLTE